MYFYKVLNKLFTTDAYFHDAIGAGRIKTVAEVIDLDVKLDSYYVGCTSLQCSLLYEQPECTALLLDKGADPNLRFKTSYYTNKPLQLSLECYYKSEVKILALYGANLVDIIFTSKNQHLQELVVEKLKDYSKRKDLEQSLKTSVNMAEKIKIYSQLSQLWSKQCENEECVAYRNHYQQKAKIYHSKAEQLIQENKSAGLKAFNIFSEEKVSIPLLEQPVQNEAGSKLKRQ